MTNRRAGTQKYSSTSIAVIKKAFERMELISSSKPSKQKKYCLFVSCSTIFEFSYS